MNEIPQLNIPLINNMLGRMTHKPLTEEKDKPETIQDKLTLEFASKIQNNQELLSKFNKISYTLFQMGISPRLVMNSFLAFKYSTIQKAIEILDKDSEGLWIHKFIESDNFNCFVCEEKEDRHHSLITILAKKESESLNPENFELKKKISLKKENKGQNPSMPQVELSINPPSQNENAVIRVNLRDCSICWAELEDETKFKLKCDHEYCKECIIEYILEEIKNSRVLGIKCPLVECKKEFFEEDIKSLVNEDYFYKYKKFILREKVKNNPNFISCPIVNCEGFADITDNIEAQNLLINKENRELEKNEEIPDHSETTSPINNPSGVNILASSNLNLKMKDELKIKNNADAILNIAEEDNKQKNEEAEDKKIIKLVCNNLHNFCSGCNQAWHNDTACKEDKEIKQFATESGFILKRCPKCKYWTEKNEGCNHLSCKLCKYDWCWLCEQHCPMDHFAQPGPCYGKMFNDMTMEDMDMMLIVQDANNPLAMFFISFLLVFFIINTSLANMRHQNELLENPNANQNQQNLLDNIANPQPRIRERITKPIAICAMTCLLAIIWAILVISNGVLMITILINLSSMQDMEQECTPCLYFFSFLIFWLAMFPYGLLFASFWFIVASFYMIYKVCMIL